MDINLRPKAGTFFRFVIPSVASMLMYSLYTVMDGVFLSHAEGDFALAAVNLVMPYINAVFALAIFLAVGTSTVVAFELGRGNNGEADRIFTQNVWVLGVLSVLVAVLVELFPYQLAAFLGAADNTTELVVTYLRIIAPFAFCFMMGYGLEMLVKTGGHPGVSIVSICTCFVVNIALHLILVVRLRLGMAGAAVATGIAQGASFAVLLVHFLKKRSNLHLVKLSRPFPGIYKKILTLGLSDFACEISLALVVFIFNRAALGIIGESGLVTYAVIAYINNIVVMLSTGVAQGSQPLVSIACGAGRGRDCTGFYKLTLCVSAALALISFAACQLFAEGITACLLERTSPVFDYTANALRLFSFSFLPVGFNLCSASFMNATGNPARALTVSLGRGIVVITACVFILSALFGDVGLWIATPASEGIVLMLNIILTVTLFTSKRSFWNNNAIDHR